MKKQLLLITSITLLTTYTLAISVLGVSIQPFDAEVNDTVDIDASVDGEGRQIQEVTYIVEKDGVQQTTGQMKLVSGQEQSQSFWKAEDVVTIEANSGYNVEVIAESVDGSLNSNSLRFNSFEESIEIVDDGKEFGDRTFSELSITDIVVLISIGFVIYVVAFWLEVKL